MAAKTEKGKGKPEPGGIKKPAMKRKPEAQHEKKAAAKPSVDAPVDIPKPSEKPSRYIYVIHKKL
jgi:hypothetical protein